MSEAVKILKDLFSKFKILEECREEIIRAYEAMVECYQHNGKVLVCGNGGSASDADHIVAELMKGFLKKREISGDLKNILQKDFAMGQVFAEKLQMPLPAINLVAQSSLLTAIANDIDADFIFAQQVLGYGRRGDILIGLSTSGMAKNVLNAVYLARFLGMVTIGFTGKAGGLLEKRCDILIKIPDHSTPAIQELYLPVYHALCAMVESYFF